MNYYEIQYKGKNIKVEIIRKNVKNINLKVKKDLKVILTANPKVPEKFLIEFINKKTDWIVQNIEYFQQNQNNIIKNMNYETGDTLKYLGKDYELIVEKTLAKEDVKLKEKNIIIYAKDINDRNKKEKLLNNFYKNKAELIFEQRLEEIYTLVKDYNISYPEFKIRAMKRRWGSCMIYKNKIVLNLNLIKTPLECIDYVILHELCHFKYHGHNKDFYNFVAKFMPNWKKRKNILDEEYS